MNKKKIIILLLIVVVIIGIVLVIKYFNKEEVPTKDQPNYSVDVSGKLEEYVKKLSNNYYIKYAGKFKNNSGELTQAIVEYTKSEDNFAMRSSELNMHLISDSDGIYSISNRYKMIVKLPKSSIDIKEYNLAADIGQVFVKSYKEKLNNVECDVEEYLLDGKVLKYYFKEDDIRLIRYEGADISVIRLELKTNTELLNKPEGYSFAMV